MTRLSIRITDKHSSEKEKDEVEVRHLLNEGSLNQVAQDVSRASADIPGLDGLLVMGDGESTSTHLLDQRMYHMSQAVGDR